MFFVCFVSSLSFFDYSWISVHCLLCYQYNTNGSFKLLFWSKSFIFIEIWAKKFKVCLTLSLPYQSTATIESKWRNVWVYKWMNEWRNKGNKGYPANYSDKQLLAASSLQCNDRFTDRKKITRVGWVPGHDSVTNT